MKLALEYERGVYDKHGIISNRASEIINHHLNKSDIEWFHDEGGDAQIEVNSINPSNSIDELCKEFLKSEEILKKITDDNILLIPTSENGAGKGNPTKNKTIIEKLNLYEILFGKSNTNLLYKINGIHIHIDKEKNKETEQFNSLLALSPSIAFASSSPINFRGINKANCNRYLTLISPERGVFSKIPEEKGYINSMKDLDDRDLRRYKKWEKVFTKNSNLSLDIFRKHFKIHNTGYPEIRNRGDIGEGTFEFRVNDSSPIDITFAYLTLVKGFMTGILNNSKNISITNQDNHYKYTNNEIILPNEETRTKLTEIAAKDGLKDNNVIEYLANIVDFSNIYISESEQKYLEPIYQMLNYGENTSTKVINFLKNKKLKGPKYKRKDLAEANLFIHSLQQTGLSRLISYFNK